MQIGRERVTQSADADEIAALRAKAPDFKESMEIGRDWDATWKNRWPQETDAPAFKRTMLDFYQVLVLLSGILLMSVNKEMGRRAMSCTSSLCALSR